VKDFFMGLFSRRARQIPPVDAIQFAQGLPMAFKGIYINQYNPSHAPVLLRHPGDFVDDVCYNDGRSAVTDFPHPRFVEDSIAAVFRVLERHMDYGQVEQIKRMMNDEIAYLFS
jgi:uncharacterized protein (DUF2267 family)